MRILSVTACALSLLGPNVAWSQATYDPPTSQRPPPNVMLLLDATRTTSINGQTCRGLCHVEGSCGGAGGEWDCNLYKRGETRLQLARRVLTGGYGWNTSVNGADGLPADARVRTDGVMDGYKVRWGVSYYDALGVRLAIDPTTNSEAAQKAVIDFNNTPNDAYGPGGPTGLNSFMIYPRTTRCCGNSSGSPWSTANYTRLPWWDQNGNWASRQAVALQWLRDYWRPGVHAPRWMPGTGASGYPQFFPPGTDPNDESVIDGDIANTMVTAGAGGCRRNLTIMMQDGHGGGSYSGLSNGQSAASIYNLPGPAGALPSNLRNQVFAIHFGVADKPNADRVADFGWDGVSGGSGITQAFDGAPGGAITDLTPMHAAFSAIFSTVLAGDYVGAAPTVTRLGDHLAKTQFTLRSCAGLAPWQCNIGRPGFMQWIRLNPDGSLGATEWDAGKILRSRLASDRKLYTTRTAGHANAATETNCGALGSCSSKTALLAPVSSTYFGALANFLRGEPGETFANTVKRGDANGNGTITDAADDPYKLSSVANSRPVIVGAPPGIGQELEYWNAFRDRYIQRSSTYKGDNSWVQVKKRDQVVYVGGNDGFLHAFLTGKATGTPPAGQTVAYGPIGTSCPVAVGTTQSTNPMCDGLEIWGYSPRLLQPKNWPAARGGHVYMVDGAPVVEDVLFTKGQASSPGVCASYPCASNRWEYRTVLVNCLGAGGPGCFAMDVSNPWDPQLLWERSFTTVTGKGTSTSRPVIARAKKVISGVEVPYYVALMGGGQNESSGSGTKGTFIAVGLEDGVVYTTPVGDAAVADFAAEPACLDVDGDTFVDTCYATTTKADVYKIRLSGGDPAAMSMLKFFEGRHVNAANSTSIRSFAKIVATTTRDNKLDLFFATGDLENVAQPGEQNYLFKLKDEDPRAMVAWTAAKNVDRQTDTCTGSSPNLTPISAGRGTMRLAAGEKVVFNPALANGTVFFTSFRPNANPCLPGDGYLYGIRYDSCEPGLVPPGGGPEQDKAPVGAGLPSEVTVNYSTGGVYVAKSDTTVVRAGDAPANTGFRLRKLFWKENW